MTTDDLDPFGRTVSQTPEQLGKHLTSYDNGAAHDKIDSSLPDGADEPHCEHRQPLRRRESRRCNRTPPTRRYRLRTHRDSSPTRSHRHLQRTRPDRYQHREDLTVTPDHSGPGGSHRRDREAERLRRLPGRPDHCHTTRDLTGAATSRTLRQGEESARPSPALRRRGQHRRHHRPRRAGHPLHLQRRRPAAHQDRPVRDGDYLYLRRNNRTAHRRHGDGAGQADAQDHLHLVANGHLGAGRLKTISDGTATITYGYDADGHRTSVAYPDGTTTSATYSDPGQLPTTIDVTGAVTTFALTTPAVQVSHPEAWRRGAGQ